MESIYRYTVDMAMWRLERSISNKHRITLYETHDPTLYYRQDTRSYTCVLRPIMADRQ